jgi:GTP-binding protein YchF
MALAVGIAGLPNVGKSTLLNALTHAGAEASNYPFCTIEQNVGIASVPDPNLERLQAILSPEEAVPATVNFVDIAGLVAGASRGEGLGNKFLAHIRQVDVILHVVRCFEEPNVAHTPGATDPVRDVKIVENEFLLADLDSAERALDKAARAAKSGRAEDKQREVALQRIVEALKGGEHLGDLQGTEKEAGSLDRSLASELNLLTAKPVLYVANTGEDDPMGEGPHVKSLIQTMGAQRVIPVSVRIEQEISEFAPDEQAQYLQEMGLKETALDLVITACYGLLQLISFYTIAHNKLRAWSLRRGQTAPEAAGQVHTDMERGFIRAEVMGLKDLLQHGNRQALHDQGLIHIVGRDYVVQDKDILQFHFKA